MEDSGHYAAEERVRTIQRREKEGCLGNGEQTMKQFILLLMNKDF